jgi:hypothetical protein
MWKYYFSGLVGSGAPGWFVMIISSLYNPGSWGYVILIWLFGGISAGYIGAQLSKMFNGSLTTLKTFGLEVLAAFLGFLISALILWLTISIWMTSA